MSIPHEHYEKMAMIESLSAAITRAQVALSKNPGYNGAARVQALKRQRADLLATMPPLRVVE